MDVDRDVYRCLPEISTSKTAIPQFYGVLIILFLVRDEKLPFMYSEEGTR